MGRDMGPILEKISRLEQSNKQLVAFAREAIDTAFQGGGLDGGDIQEMGVKYGLLMDEKFDPAKHGEDLSVEFEEGDTIYVLTDIIRTKAIESTAPHSAAEAV